MTIEQMMFFLEWAATRANLALQQNGVFISEQVRKDMQLQVTSLITQAGFWIEGNKLTGVA